MDNLNNKDGFVWRGEFITDPRQTHCGRFEVKDSHMVYGQNYLDWLETKYRKIKFCIFDVEDGEAFTGYHPIKEAHEHLPKNHIRRAQVYWNNWLCPYVLKHEHDRLYNWFTEETPEPQSLEEIEAYRNAKPNEHGLYYWGGGYTWEEHKE
tara:strand:- start:334 stop:786 length:453 start_codon:yes stop_codon:yes gene_type:complete